MNGTIKEDLLNVIIRGTALLEQRNASELKELSNHTTHNASIFQDEYSISIAVIIYSLSKIIERAMVDTRDLVFQLKRAKEYLVKDDYANYKNATKKLLEMISHLDSSLKLYIDEIISQAEIKKGGKIYEHGISMAQAASILGILEWELAGYVGRTRMSDIYGEKIEVKKRLEYARSLFLK